MAAQGLRASYEYETSPRKLQPEYEPKKSPYKRKKSSLKTKKKASKKTKVVKKAKYNYRYVIYVASAFIMLFTISYRNSQITEEYNEKESIKTQVSQVQKENEQLRVSIENSLNLNTVEQEASNKLGMQKLDNNQKVYVNLPKSDYIEAVSEEVIINDSTSWFQNILHKLTQIIK